MQFNSVKIDGNHNIVLQNTNGKIINKTFNEFLEPFIKDKEELITSLQKTLKDKEIIQSLSSDKIQKLTADLEKAFQEKSELAEQIEKILKDFSEKDLSNSSQIYRKAFDLFITANLDEALELLSEETLKNGLKRIEEQELSLKTERANLASTYILKAKILQLKSDLQGAAENFEAATVISPEWATYIEANRFYDFLKNYPKAEYYVEKALEAANSPYERALTLNNLANLQIDTRRFESAQKSLTESIVIRTKLAEDESEISESDLANSLNSLCVLQMELNEFDKAEETIWEVLRIRKKLANANPIMYADDIYRPNVAAARVNLANLQCIKNQFINAEASYFSALHIYGMLGTDHAYQTNIASIYLNLGNLYFIIKEHVKAENSYLTSLNIFRKQSELNGQAFHSDVAKVLDGLTRLFMDTDEWEKAKLYNHQSIELYERLSAFYPDVYLSGLVSSLTKEGALQCQEHDFKGAMATFNKALGLLRGSKNLKSNENLALKAEIQHKIGELQRARKQYDKAMASFQKALAIRRKIAESDPHSVALGIGESLDAIASIKLQQKDYIAAETAYKEILKITRALAIEQPYKYRPYVAGTLSNLAKLMAEQEEFQQAEILFEEAIGIFEELSKYNPPTHLPHLAYTQSSLALLQKCAGNLEKAKQNYSDALSNFKTLAKVEPNHYNSDILIAINNIANIQRQLNNLEATDILYDGALEILANGSYWCPPEFKVDLAVIFCNISIFYTYIKSEKEKAITTAQKSLEIIKSSDTKDPIAPQTLEAANGILAYWKEK